MDEGKLNLPLVGKDDTNIAVILPSVGGTVSYHNQQQHQHHYYQTNFQHQHNLTLPPTTLTSIGGYSGMNVGSGGGGGSIGIGIGIGGTGSKIQSDFVENNFKNGSFNNG